MYMTERSFLSLNTKHYQGNGVYEYKFNPSDFQDCTISLFSFAMNNSLFNIKEKYNNNKFSITWIDNTVYNFVIPDGYYEFEDINTYIEQQCLLNGLYLTKDSGTKTIFFISLSTNPSSYKTQIDTYAVPTSSQASTLGYSKPSSAWSYPTIATTPQITFSTGLLEMLGMTVNTTFPPAQLSTDYTYLSDTYPKLLKIFAMFIACNMCDSKLNIHPRILTQIPISVKYGSLINVSNTMLSQLPIRSGQYDSVRIELLDQDYNPLELNDPEFSLVLLIEKKLKQKN